MSKITLVIGGCKSGKSRHALQLAEQYQCRKYFMATCVPLDDEMKKRVARHQAERDGSWRSMDVPLELPEAMAAYDGEDRVILIDCLTLWVTNLLMANESQEYVEKEVERLINSLGAATCPVILVSNEVGAGIVPENRLARLFRDVAGLANQRVAAAADRVIYTVAGIPMTIKGETGI